MKIILDKNGQPQAVWTIEKSDSWNCGLETEVGTYLNAGRATPTYFRLKFFNGAFVELCKFERTDEGFELELLLNGEDELELMTNHLSFAGAALKELTRASAALEEHLN